MHIWYAAWHDDHDRPPVRVELGNPAVSARGPTVAPDQPFIVFDDGKTKGELGRLCIAFHEGGRYGKPIDPGDTVNRDMPWGTHIAPDGHRMYFTGQSGNWQLDLAPWLRRHAADTATASM